jgi:hypothetical protein
MYQIGPASPKGIMPAQEITKEIGLSTIQIKIK